MTLEEKVKKRIIEEYGSVSSFCRETRMPYSTVTSGLRRGIAGMGKKNADIILDALDLQLDSSNGCDLGDSIISENLLRIRMEKGLTQKHVCKAIGVSQGALSNYETGVSCQQIVFEGFTLFSSDFRFIFFSSGFRFIC